MPNPRVLCLGEMLFDCLADQPGAAEVVTSWTSYAGGAPANVACALSKMGTSSAWLGSLGTDAAGDQLLTVLESSGVETKGVQRHASAPTRVIEVLRDASGDRIFGGFRRLVSQGASKNEEADGKGESWDSESVGDAKTTIFADAQMQAAQLPSVLFETAEYLVMGSIPLASPDSRETVNRALDFADDYYLKVFLDVNWRPRFWPEPEAARETILAYVQRADFLKLSQEEAEFLFETADPLDILRQQEQLEGVFITSGSKGCAYACTQGLVGRVPAFVAPAIDTTGAGDSFVAGVIHQLLKRGLRGLSSTSQIEEMLRYASAAGALATMKAGAIAAQPTDAEIESFLVGRVD